MTKRIVERVICDGCRRESEPRSARGWELARNGHGKDLCPSCASRKGAGVVYICKSSATDVQPFYETYPRRLFASCKGQL